MKNRLSLAIALTAGLAITSILSCATKPPRTTRLVITGEANSQAQPDTALLNISVVTQHQQALNAQQENARKTDAVIHAVQAASGASPDIKTSDYNLQPQESYNDDRLPSIIGYEARNSVLVTLTDLTKVGAVIDASTKAGANSIEKVSFTLRDSNPARGQALAEATRQAMNKAQSIAQALGGRVLRVVEEHEGGADSRAFPDYESDERADMNANLALSRSARKPATPVEAGALNVKSLVRLVVEIETP